mgnify:CR=1 FL=1
MITRTSPTFAAPVLLAGKAVPRSAWTPSSIVREDWGTFRVEIGAQWEVVETDPDVWVMVKVQEGIDYTEFRGARTLIESLSWADPFGEETGQITIPAMTPWDVVGASSWGGPIPPGTNIDIWRVLPAWLQAATGRTDPVGFWHGVILDPEVADGDGQPEGATYQLAGAMVAEISTRGHMPQPLDDSRDIGQVLAQACDTRDAYSRPSQGWRFDLEVTTTDIEVRMRGSVGQMVGDFMRDVLAVARDAGHTWTIARAFDTDGFLQPRKYFLYDASTPVATTTIRGGMPGWVFAPRSDVTQDPNAIFGAGTRRDGGYWSGMVYPLLAESDPPTYPGPLSYGSIGSDVSALQGRLRQSGWPDVTVTGVFDDETITGLNAMYKAAGHAQTGEIESEDDWDLAWSTDTGTTDLSSGYRRPLARDTSVERWTYYADGSISGENPYRDPNILPVDADLSYGDRISRGRATTNANRLVADFADGPLVMGSATLTIDPPDMSRLDLRECGQIVADYTAAGETPGSRALSLRIARLEIQPESDAMPLSMTLATRPYPALDLATRLDRDRSAASNPARSFYAQLHRAQRPWKDVNGWDSESGAGIIRSLHCAAGEWTVVKFIGAQRGSIMALKANSDPASRYAMALFGDAIDAAGVAALVSAPLSEAPTSAGWWAEVSESDLEDAAWIESWGMYTQACGYYPYAESDDPTPSTSGKTRDFQTYTFESLSPPWLWLAIWSEDEADYDVTMRVATALD